MSAYQCINGPRSAAIVTATFQTFKDRIVGDLVPIFSNDPRRGSGCEGFKEDWKNVTEKDAADFLLALGRRSNRT